MPIVLLGAFLLAILRIRLGDKPVLAAIDLMSDLESLPLSDLINLAAVFVLLFGFGNEVVGLLLYTALRLSPGFLLLGFGDEEEDLRLGLGVKEVELDLSLLLDLGFDKRPRAGLRLELILVSIV